MRYIYIPIHTCRCQNDKCVDETTLWVGEGGVLLGRMA